ncbi:hypothetical protein D9M71_637710 [compost metagenome]
MQHHARRARHFLQHPLHLLGRTDQGIDVFDRNDAVETGDHGLGHGVQSLAGRIRDQMDMKIGGETRRGADGAHGSDRLLILHARKGSDSVPEDLCKSLGAVRHRLGADRAPIGRRIL